MTAYSPTEFAEHLQAQVARILSSPPPVRTYDDVDGSDQKEARMWANGEDSDRAAGWHYPFDGRGAPE